uniref:Uncharacterized protein n=1 Tax=Chlamydomonas euryale TaxID=1486919 RepID=A0A7R9VAS7_9CHLO|mmetsp:Transcript_28766/g.85078  ORF Transcript_28766/g.85078 Transcript_28766/m.85078 type:complete len:317 (+) Transcript_28766:448-1398(+)
MQVICLLRALSEHGMRSVPQSVWAPLLLPLLRVRLSYFSAAQLSFILRHACVELGIELGSPRFVEHRLLPACHARMGAVASVAMLSGMLTGLAAHACLEMAGMSDSPHSNTASQKSGMFRASRCPNRDRSSARPDKEGVSSRRNREDESGRRSREDASGRSNADGAPGLLSLGGAAGRLGSHGASEGPKHDAAHGALTSSGAAAGRSGGGGLTVRIGPRWKAELACTAARLAGRRRRWADDEALPRLLQAAAVLGLEDCVQPLLSAPEALNNGCAGARPSAAVSDVPGAGSVWQYPTVNGRTAASPFTLDGGVPQL